MKLSFIAQPGTTTALCVAYTVYSEKASPSDFDAYISLVNVVPIHDSQNDTSGYYYSYSDASNIKIISDAASLALTNLTSGSKVNVVYTITTAPGSSGFYDLHWPGSCPAMIPFAVIGGSQSVNASDFPGYLQPSSCEDIGYPGDIIGYSGLTTGWISQTHAATKIQQLCQNQSTRTMRRRPGCNSY
jgi:hypothetical protein